MSKEIKKSIEEKKKAWRKWKETGREKDKAVYRKKTDETRKKVRKGKNALERQVAQCRKSNPKSYMCKEARRWESLKRGITLHLSMIFEKVNLLNFFFLSLSGKA